MPSKKNPKEINDFFSWGSLCNSGIRSEAAMYMNPPAAKGRIKGITPWIRVENKYPIMPPITAVSCEIKLYIKAFALLKPP